MKEKIKKIIFGYGPGFILGIVSACTISVIAATYFPSNDVTYDNKESGLTSTNVQGAIDELYTECTTIPAGDQIIENAELEKDPYECRYFFTGANPNNYITFNNETAGWRIISVECDGTIKIMKTANINTNNNLTWDSSNNNDWASPASLNTYLNGTYYNGLNVTAQSQIVVKDFSIGAVTGNNNDLATQISNENNKKWNGKIALATVSEYIRSNSNKSSCGSYKLNNDNYNSCKNSTWMYYSSDWWWTLSPYSDSHTEVFSISSTGGIGAYRYQVASKFIGVRPTLYLSSDIKITRGDGSQSNPYQIS